MIKVLLNDIDLKEPFCPLQQQQCDFLHSWLVKLLCQVVGSVKLVGAHKDSDCRAHIVHGQVRRCCLEDLTFAEEVLCLPVCEFKKVRVI